MSFVFVVCSKNLYKSAWLSKQTRSCKIKAGDPMKPKQAKRKQKQERREAGRGRRKRTKRRKRKDNRQTREGAS